METVYKVAIHYGDENGYIEYDLENHSAKVALEPAEKKQEVERYLAAAHEINVPAEGLLDFHKKVVRPLDTLEDFKLALTRLWGETEVYVDWSRPVDIQF